LKVEQLLPLLTVRDIEKSIAFYRDCLGFTLTGKWETDGKLSWCSMKLGNASIMLQKAEEDPPEAQPPDGRKAVTFYFLCTNAAPIGDALKAKGLQFSEAFVAFCGTKQIFLTDPDGHELCFEHPTDG
jgi:uncharacterized glyoxalase superfamily protein PhnB